MTGASEPVLDRMETAMRFWDTFQRRGFAGVSKFPCYHSAETLSFFFPRPLAIRFVSLLFIRI